MGSYSRGTGYAAPGPWAMFLVGTPVNRRPGFNSGTQSSYVEGIPMKGKKPVIDKAVLNVLEATGYLSLPVAMRALKCSIDLLNAAQIAGHTNEDIGRLVPLKDLEATPGFDAVLTALIDAEPDCSAAAGIAWAVLKEKLKEIKPLTMCIQ